jgi:hypothetical protein
MPDSTTLPPVRRPRESQNDAYLREIEIDLRDYLPADVDRDSVTSLPDEITIDLGPMKEKMRKQMGS